jgi:hypothetical protein
MQTPDNHAVADKTRETSARGHGVRGDSDLTVCGREIGGDGAASGLIPFPLEAYPASQHCDLLGRGVDGGRKQGRREGWREGRKERRKEGTKVPE